MGRKQTELPGTRRDDEPPPPKSIKALDEACEALEKAKGKATRAGQGVVEAKLVVDGLLREHKLSAYLYESANGVEKKVFIAESVKTAKVKKAKVDDDSNDGDEE